MGYAVLATVAQMEHPTQRWVFEKALVSGAPLACWRFEEEVPHNTVDQKIQHVEVPYKTMDHAETILAEYEACTDRVLKDRLWRKYNTRMSIGDRQTATIPVWLWKMGNAIVVAQANEAYSMYQQAVRAAFPAYCIAFVNIANGYVGYLAPQELYGKDIYAVWQSPYEKGSLEILIEETKAAIHKLITNET